ncbi:MAG: lipoate--protein ligase family protein [Candidatus Hodarchaeales archaeon]|jgi:lipoate-protein ligase A
MTKITHEWDLILLKESEGLDTQVVWHAAALARSNGIQPRDLIIIDWPTEPFVGCGFHQVIERVVDIDYCTKNEIPIYRRACGGGAVYLDSNQLFYHIVAHIDSTIVPRNINNFFEKTLLPVAQTYRHFGIDAEYKPVNDILVNNRKISGNGAGILENAQILVGNFILDFPREEMAQILKVPNEKFRDKVIKSLEAGISSFKDELGYIPPRDSIIAEYLKRIETTFNISLKETQLKPGTLELMEKLRETYLTKEWLFQVKARGNQLTSKVKIHGSAHVVEGMHKSKGGLITVICEFTGSILSGILISGDFWIHPDTILPKFEKFLVNHNLAKGDLSGRISTFLEENECETPGTSASDLAQAIQNAYSKISST